MVMRKFKKMQLFGFLKFPLLRTFARKSSNIDFLLQVGNDSCQKCQNKKSGGHRLCYGDKISEQQALALLGGRASGFWVASAKRETPIRKSDPNFETSVFLTRYLLV